jgi:spermidine synthase
MKIPKFKKYLNKLSSRQLIEKQSSEVNSLLEVVRIGDKTLLNSLNTNYSYGGLHRVFQKAFKEVNIVGEKIKHTLILGFGAGSVASILREELMLECRIIGVERDPEVVRLGNEYFNLARFQQLEIIIKDAADYIRENDAKFDLIVVDVYVDFAVPESCQTIDFVTNLNKRLEPGGIILFNKLIYNHQTGKEATELENKFRTLAGSTTVIKVKENVRNRVIVHKKPSNDEAMTTNQ